MSHDMLYLQDNYPTMSTIASDLSPFYLTKARDNVKYWKSRRAASLDLGGTDKTGTAAVGDRQDSSSC